MLLSISPQVLSHFFLSIPTSRYRHKEVLDLFCYNVILLSIADTGSQIPRRPTDRGSLAAYLLAPFLSMAPYTRTRQNLGAASLYSLNYTHSLPRIPSTRRTFPVQSRGPRLACSAASGTSALHHPPTLGIRSLPGPCLVVFMSVKFMAHCENKPFGTLLCGKSKS